MPGWFGQAKVPGGLLYGSPVAHGGQFGPTFTPTGPTSQWTARTSGTANTLEAVAANGATWLTGGTGTFLKSTDGGVTWNSFVIAATLSTLNSVAFTNSLWLVGGIDNTGNTVIYTSPDASTWTLRFSAALGGEVIGGFAWNGSIFLAVNSATLNGDTFTSPTGVVWTRHANALLGFSVAQANPAVSGSTFICAGVNTTGNFALLTTPDGTTITSQTTNLSAFTAGNTVAASAIVLGSKFIVAGGLASGNSDVETATVLSPWNGNLEDAAFGAGSNFIECLASGPAAHGGDLAFAGGDNGLVSSTHNGLAWTSENPGFGTDSLFAIAAGQDGSANPIFIAVGTSGKISSRAT